METADPSVFPDSPFRFGMRQVVKHKGQPGTVIGRAEHARGEPTYLVRPIVARRPFTQPAKTERAPMAWPGVQKFAPATRADGAGEACPKPVEHRNPALLAMARGKRCLFLIPGTCNHDQRTTVACHENQGKGMGTKASDARSAQGCSACHEAYDRGPALREVKRGWFHVAHGRQVLEWQRVVGDLSETPRNRRSAHWALCLLESESNPTPALDTRAQLAMKGIAT